MKRKIIQSLMLIGLCFCLSGCMPDTNDGGYNLIFDIVDMLTGQRP